MRMHRLWGVLICGLQDCIARRSTGRWAPCALSAPAIPSTHNLGTNRMSANATDSMVTKQGQTHDIKNLSTSDGRQFTTGAAEENPTLTIFALAIRQADDIAEKMGKREI